MELEADFRLAALCGILDLKVLGLFESENTCDNVGGNRLATHVVVPHISVVEPPCGLDAVLCANKFFL